MNKLKFTILILANLLLSPIYIILFIFCGILSIIPIFPTRIAKQNLSERLNINGIKANYYIALIYINYVFYFIEAFIFNILSINICIVTQDKYLNEALSLILKTHPLSQDRGCVFILPHMANVEMYSLPVIKIYSENQKTKVYALAQPSHFKFINKILYWYRKSPGLDVIWTDNKLFTHMENIIVKNKASICMLIDQKPKKGGLFINFFGKYSAFPSSGLRMCLNQNMAVIYVVAKRIIPGFLILKFRAGINAHLKNESSSQEINMDELIPAEIFNFEKIKEREKNTAIEMSYFVNWIENEIRQNPSQWCWDYKKWSREPSSN
ncbi:lysophospholipid acyltransferase family protein [Fluviispira multicolorata]|uniref:KDO2-lipid IV(A) lauroyltransferase n=1 Tax=Fluviispira multicolorata TaxID=2654512 RepID=A0A833JC11_9BACT|nr:lysophospholipid acyltransferase family protein [Fluviispira multicolorata]KAB8029981.1 hypothetical protein GCL57_10620 [Fluviispira multicolorata]